MSVWVVPKVDAWRVTLNFPRFEVLFWCSKMYVHHQRRDSLIPRLIRYIWCWLLTRWLIVFSFQPTRFPSRMDAYLMIVRLPSYLLSYITLSTLLFCSPIQFESNISLLPAHSPWTYRTEVCFIIILKMQEW